jgi:hypothetical protein
MTLSVSNLYNIHLEFSTNSRHTLKELKKRIERKLIVNVLELLETKNTISPSLISSLIWMTAGSSIRLLRLK